MKQLHNLDVAPEEFVPYMVRDVVHILPPDDDILTHGVNSQLHRAPGKPTFWAASPASTASRLTLTRQSACSLSSTCKSQPQGAWGIQVL